MEKKNEQNKATDTSGKGTQYLINIKKKKRINFLTNKGTANKATTWFNITQQPQD